MAAHGKLRRERGLQAEYEAQVKGERALWAWSTVETPSVSAADLQTSPDGVEEGAQALLLGAYLASTA